jgi:hypothetical protein
LARGFWKIDFLMTKKNRRSLFFLIEKKSNFQKPRAK